MAGVSVLLVAQALALLSLLVGLVIFSLALYGYRRNDSRAMLALGCGIAMLTVVSTIATILAARLFGGRLAPVGSEAAELVGMCLILYAIVLARRE
ncbi:hypothetical protein NDI56_10665 [Haloarcula sp. S1CR25-12]|uniref:Uncharacterized protein n=1 Tax=Haloarcula saliterrae TaxID=2950534 RepID=A0ABU2FC88_9EURY|nr:hypothetical protein [Haloarcula sp. S1CR25-12]MDS0259854.1 hypothetical protein [Haloarcula sp. S1CR25-12]